LTCYDHICQFLLFNSFIEFSNHLQKNNTDP
jgi:hypothetical protein